MFDPTKYTKSKWMKGTDLKPGSMLAVTVSRAFEETFPQTNETKPCLEFSDNDQGLVLNKTRVTAMISLFGPDPRLWIGQRINLTTAPSGFKNEPTIMILPAKQQQQNMVPGRIYLPDGDTPEMPEREYTDEDRPF